MRDLRALLSAFLILSPAAAAAATYDIDVVHSQVGFKVRHMMVGKTAGHFNKFSGTFDYDAKDPKAWAAKAVIEASSVDTANAKRDEHLRGGDFFDAAKFPTLEFASTGVKGWKGGKGKLHGNLTLHGVTKPVVLELTLNGAEGDRAGFSAATKIDRRDFEMKWNKALDKGGIAIGNEVEIILEVEGTVQKKP